MIPRSTSSRRFFGCCMGASDREHKTPRQRPYQRKTVPHMKTLCEMLIMTFDHHHPISVTFTRTAGKNTKNNHSDNHNHSEGKGSNSSPALTQDENVSSGSKEVSLGRIRHRTRQKKPPSLLVPSCTATCNNRKGLQPRKILLQRRSGKEWRRRKSMVATARELRLRMSLILSLIDGLKLHC